MRSNPAAESHAHSTLDNETRKLVAKSRKAIRRLILALKRVIVIFFKFTPVRSFIAIGRPA